MDAIINVNFNAGSDQVYIEERDRGMADVELDYEPFAGRIMPGESKVILVNGKKAIKKIKLKSDSDDLAQALRSTVMTISFDGQQTVWAPVGDFFGTGYKIHLAILVPEYYIQLI